MANVIMKLGVIIHCVGWQITYKVSNYKLFFSKFEEPDLKTTDVIHEVYLKLNFNMIYILLFIYPCFFPFYFLVQVPILYKLCFYLLLI